MRYDKLRTIKRILNSKILPQKLKPVAKWKFRWGVVSYPYFRPWKLVPTIIKIRKKPYTFRNNYKFKIFGYYVYIGTPILLQKVDLGYKTKWSDDDYRYEWAPAILFHFFGVTLYKMWYPPKTFEKGFDEYYTQILMVMHYDSLEEAKENWGWVDTKTSESTFKLDKI